MTTAPDNKAAALEMRDAYLDKLDAMLDTASDASFSALSSLRAAFVRDINQRIAQLPALLEFIPPDTVPALVVAHRLYGDATRDGDLVRRNQPEHPGFMPSGRAVEYLS